MSRTHKRLNRGPQKFLAFHSSSGSKPQKAKNKTKAKDKRGRQRILSLGLISKLPNHKKCPNIMIRTDRRKNGLGVGATTEPILGQFHDYSSIGKEFGNKSI